MARVPPLPPSLPRRGNALTRWLGRSLLAAAGWRIEGEFPDRPKLIAIVAPLDPSVALPSVTPLVPSVVVPESVALMLPPIVTVLFVSETVLGVVLVALLVVADASLDELTDQAMLLFLPDDSRRTA